MPKQNQPQSYKTESQLKEEARAKKEAEALSAAPKSGLLKKGENFWYHYKWHTFAIAFTVFVLAFFVKDMLFRPRPDITVVAVSEGYFTDYDFSLVTSALEQYAADFNGDKKVEISVDFILLPRFEGENDASASAPAFMGSQQEMANAMKLMAVFSAGTDPIYLLDEAAYDYIAGVANDGGDGEPFNVFDERSVPAEKLGGEAADIFSGMRFYLRAAKSGEQLYEYGKQILNAIDRS